jgi:Ran GTPase-activating protein (RanGAP) involved in mRNA processing and transport
VRANPNPCPTDKGGMDTTYAERVTQANLTIQELISALAEVQKLIASHNEDCHLGLITGEKLGTAYYRLAEKLTQALLFC